MTTLVEDLEVEIALLEAILGKPAYKSLYYVGMCWIGGLTIVNSGDGWRLQLPPVAPAAEMIRMPSFDALIHRLCEQLERRARRRT